MSGSAGAVLVRILAVTTVAVLSLAPQPVAAQDSSRVARIAILSPQDAVKIAAWDRALRLGLRDLGWEEGRNLAFIYRHANGRRERLPALAAELVRLDPVLVVALNSYSARAVQRLSTRIPIVIPYTADAVRQGLVLSLARPGGNITGLSERVPEMSGKRLQLLKELMPNMDRVALLWRPANDASRLTQEETRLAARQLGLRLQILPVQKVDDLGGAFAEAAVAGARAIIITPGTLFGANLKTLAKLALRHRLPSIWVREAYTAAGGLLSYGPDRVDLFRRAAGYIDKILRGAKPADLPIERATRFYLSVNLKTAKALGIAIPSSVLLRADRVIE